jgi:hypothetical protein
MTEPHLLGHACCLDPNAATEAGPRVRLGHVTPLVLTKSFRRYFPSPKIFFASATTSGDALTIELATC